MACSKLTRKVTLFMSVLTLLSFKAGFSLSGTCRPVCFGSDCVTVNLDSVDFTTAEETCRGISGDLMTFQRETDESFLDAVRQELSGNFWIGLRLPAGACSNLSAPLRGYEWTSGSKLPSLTPSFTTWKGNVKVCSPRCVSLSIDQRWTESLCSDKKDGFLCRTRHKDACKAQGLSDPTFFQSPYGCFTALCEHNCTDVKGGYKCSCKHGYIPDTKDPRRCNQYCGQNKCPAVCEKNTDICYCPGGFILDGKFCEDIDECLMKQCEQECKNTFGAFECSCREGFVPKDGVKCIQAVNNDSFVITNPITEGSVKPEMNNNTLKVSASRAGGFLWIWSFVAVAIVVLIITVRFQVVKRQKLGEQCPDQQPTTTSPADNI